NGRNRPIRRPPEFCDDIHVGKHDAHFGLTLPSLSHCECWPFTALWPSRQKVLGQSHDEIGAGALLLIGDWILDYLPNFDTRRGTGDRVDMEVCRQPVPVEHATAEDRVAAPLATEAPGDLRPELQCGTSENDIVVRIRGVRARMRTPDEQ